MMREEQDLRVDIVREGFTEGGDSILDVFFGEPLREKLQDD